MREIHNFMKKNLKPRFLELYIKAIERGNSVNYYKIGILEKKNDIKE